MPERLQADVFSTAYPSLTGFCFRAFYLNSFFAVIAAAGRAGMVRQPGAIALGAIDERRSRDAEVIASLALACFGVFSFWYSHSLFRSFLLGCLGFGPGQSRFAELSPVVVCRLAGTVTG